MHFIVSSFFNYDCMLNEMYHRIGWWQCIPTYLIFSDIVIQLTDIISNLYTVNSNIVNALIYCVLDDMTVLVLQTAPLCRMISLWTKGYLFTNVISIDHVVYKHHYFKTLSQSRLDLFTWGCLGSLLS